MSTPAQIDDDLRAQAKYASLGDSTFFAGIREYYTKHKHGTALTADLQLALQHASGRNLAAFFDQWLRRPGFPEVSVSWTNDPTRHQTSIRVSQSGRFGYFEFPLQIVLVDRNAGRHPYTIAVAARAETVAEFEGQNADIERVMVDPEVTLLVRVLSPYPSQ